MAIFRKLGARLANRQMLAQRILDLAKLRILAALHMVDEEDLRSIRTVQGYLLIKIRFGR